MLPPTSVKIDALSPTNKNAHIGPRTDSDNIIIPTNADGVVLAPIVINMNPKPTWKNPAKKPKKISWYETMILFERKKPIKQQQIPATNCAGTMSIDGCFLTMIINIANVIGILKAAKFPDNSPGDKELPTIRNTPVIAKIIEVKVMAEIFSFKKK